MPESFDPKPDDVICREHCQLVDCDEEHLACLFRAITNPNKAQRAFIRGKRIRDKRERKNEYNRLHGPAYRALTKEKKREYDRQRYQANKRNAERRSARDGRGV